MHKMIKLFILISVIGAVSLISIYSESSAGLDEKIKNAIYVAYMNGYVAALKLDMERIMQIKKDRELMKAHIQSAAREYIAVVESMN